MLFSMKPKTTELYANCEKCRVKNSEHKKKKYAADKAKREAAIEAGCKLLGCDRCRLQKPLEAFETNQTTGKPLGSCKPCNETKKVYDAEYQQSEDGKAAKKRAQTSDKCKASQKRYDESEKGKETRKRFWTSDKGKAAIKRSADNLTERHRDSTAMRMDHKILGNSNWLLGRGETSPKFIKRTSFTSEVQYLGVVKATFAPGMNFANHGTVWELDHKIPREAYNFEDPEDAKRCWSVKNVHAMTVADNKAKHWYLVDEYITAAGVENFPKAWNGKFPDAAFKADHNAKMLAQKAIDDKEAAEEQPSGSNDVGPMEAYDSD